MLYKIAVKEYEVRIGKKALKGIAKLGKKEREIWRSLSQIFAGLGLPSLPIRISVLLAAADTIVILVITG